tara:strand:- start:312 stop:683 length:372 start_codon:yes stop_codon:yes gene_type:complete
MEPEPMPEDIQYQDILLDDIKEYRKILSALLDRLNTSPIKECKDIREDFDVSLLEEYPYAYSGTENVENDVKKHRNEIKRIMECLEKQDYEYSKEVYNECFNAYIYQYYYLGNQDCPFNGLNS